MIALEGFGALAAMWSAVFPSRFLRSTSMNWSSKGGVSRVDTRASTEHLLHESLMAAPDRDVQRLFD